MIHIVDCPGTKCRSPGKLSNGKWSCSVNSIPLIGDNPEDDTYQGNLGIYYMNTNLLLNFILRRDLPSKYHKSHILATYCQYGVDIHL
jgi:hypothetical protein